MTTKELMEKVDNVLMSGILEADCTECGNTVICEPDAKTSWCDICGKVVKVNNFMIQNGLI